MDHQYKKIYIVFFKTPTKIGKLIRCFTRYKYNHIALSLNNKFETFYSFARYNKSTPFVGGFVTESNLRYDSKKVETKICEIPVSVETYYQIEEYIKTMQENAKEYIYNMFSAIASTTHKTIKVDKAYTCVEFVRMILNKFEIIDDGYNKGNFHNIHDLDIELEKYQIYEGEMMELENIDNWGNDKFKERISKKDIVVNTIKHIGKLMYRKVHI